MLQHILTLKIIQYYRSGGKSQSFLVLQKAVFLVHSKQHMISSPRMLLRSVKRKTAIPSSALPMKHGYCVRKNRMCEDKRHAILLVKEIANHPPHLKAPCIKVYKGKKIKTHYLQSKDFEISM